MASCLAAFEPYPAIKGYGSIGNPWQPASSDAAYHQQAGIVEPYPTGIWVPESLECDYLPPGVTRVLSVTDRCPYSMRLRTDWAVRDFVFVKEIGTGNASTVWYAFCKKTSAPLAIKTYKKRKLSPLNRCQVAREINIHSQLDHPNIIALYASFEDNDKVYLLQEYAEGGDLFDEMKRTMGRMPENQLVTAVLLPMMSALLAMHSAGFIHRDIKPENTLFAAGRVLKLADFGLAVNHIIERPVTRLGTLDYMAPEVLVCPDKHLPSDNKKRPDLWYTPAVDAWALGVLAYELAVGRPPFGMSTRDETIRAIRQSPPGFPEFMSPGLVDYISHALVKPADQRSTLADLMQHPWIMEHARRAGMDAQVLAYLRVHQPAEKQLLASAAVGAGLMQHQPAVAAAPSGPLPPVQQHQQQSLMAQHTPAAAAVGAVSGLPEAAVGTAVDGSSAAIPSITVTSPTIASLAAAAAAATSAGAVPPAAAAAAASYLAGLLSPEPHMMMLGADVAAAAAGMASGGPPRVKKTAKRTGMPRCFSSKNVAGLSSLAALGGGHQQGGPHGHGHIHWHANGETLALHVPGLMLDLGGADSPRSNSPNTSSPTAAAAAAAAGLGGRSGMTRAASLISPLHLHKHQHLQDGYNPMYGGGLGALLPGLASMQAAAAAAAAVNMQQQHAVLPGSPTRRALASARMNGGSSCSGGSKQTSSSKRCTPEPDSDLALTLLALGQNSPCSSGGTEVISSQLVQQQQLMQQYLRQQQQMQLQGNAPAAVPAHVPLQAAPAVHCQVHGSFVSPNASPRPMSRLGVSGLSSSGSTGTQGFPPVGAGVNALLGQQQQQGGQYASICSCSCGNGASVSVAASAAGSSSGRSSGTKFSPCSPMLKVAAVQHQFESPLKRVNSQGTLTGCSSNTAAAQLAPQLSLPLPLPPMQQQQQQKQADQQQVSGLMMAAELDRLQQAAAAGAPRSSAATPTPAQQAAAAAAAAAAGQGHRHTGGSSAEGSGLSAQASPAGLHMQELAEVLSSPGSVANLLQEHQQQQLQRELAAQQYAEQQQQQQLCSRRLNDMRRPVIRACSAPSLLHPALQLQLLQQQQQQQGYGWFDGVSGGSPTSHAPHDPLGPAAAAAAEVSALEQLQIAAQQQQYVQASPFAALGAALNSMDCSTPASPSGAAAAAAVVGLARVNSTGASTAEQLQQLCTAAGSTVLHGQLSVQVSGSLNGQLPPCGTHLHSAGLYRATSPGLAMLQQQQQQHNPGQLLHVATSWDTAASLAGPMQHGSYAAGAAAANGLDMSPGQHASAGYDAVPSSGRGCLSRSQSLLSDLGPLQTVPESSAATYEQLPAVLGAQPCSTNWQQQQQQLHAQQQLQEIAGALLLQQQQQQAQAAQQQQQQQQVMQLQMCAGSAGVLAGAADVYHLAAMACSQGNSTFNPAAGNTSPLNPRLLLRHAPSRLAQASSPLPPQTVVAAAAEEL